MLAGNGTPGACPTGLGRWGSRSRPRGRRDSGVGLADIPPRVSPCEALGAPARPRPHRDKIAPKPDCCPDIVLAAWVGEGDLEFSRVVQIGKHTCPNEL